MALDQRRPADAEAALRRALDIKPGFPAAQNNLGLLLKEQGRLDEAEAAFRNALTLAPNLAEVHNNLASLLLRRGALGEAEASCRRALDLTPHSAEAWNNLGAVLKEQLRLDEAGADFCRALELDPDNAEAHNNLGAVLRDQNQLDWSVSCFRRALAIEGDYAEAHYNLACALLLMGQLDEGWREYEWRWKCRGVEEPMHNRPRWTGEPLAGRTVLLQGEQGFGDILQFIRYAELVKRQGAIVIVECPPPVKSLLAPCSWIDRVVTAGERLPDFDFHLPLMSLPAMFRTSLADIPATIPYLSADPMAVERWKNELAGDRGFKIGIAWQGDTRNPRDTFRSFPLELFEPIAAIEGVSLYSLQMGSGREQLDGANGRWPITDLGDRLGDFANTAAIVQNLDLVITCCSAPAHVAGALSVPVWVPLTSVPDWRWMLNRDDSPWYPTMRLFRQSRLGDWSTVFERMRQALREQREILERSCPERRA